MCKQNVGNKKFTPTQAGGCSAPLEAPLALPLSLLSPDTVSSLPPWLEALNDLEAMKPARNSYESPEMMNPWQRSNSARKNTAPSQPHPHPPPPAAQMRKMEFAVACYR